MKALGLLLLTLFAGCQSHSQCRRDLYQSYYGSATDAFLTLRSIDRGRIDRAHELAMSALNLRLSELHDMSGTTEKDDLERQAALAHSILIYFAGHQGELAHDEWSLKVVDQLQKLLTEKSDIQKAAEIAAYLSTSTTNQIAP